MPMLPCVLCGDDQRRGTDKNGKPYFVCSSCGTQFFVRGKKGRERLEELIHNLADYDLAAKAYSDTYLDILRILNEIRALKSQIKRLESQSGLIFRNEEAEEAAKLLKIRVENLLVELEQIAERKPREI